MMSERPVFEPIKNGKDLVLKHNIQFTWYPGFSKDQKQKSIDSLHSEAQRIHDFTKILEISSKSKEALGVSCSAFNLKIKAKDGKMSTVESIYQGSKVFKNGGPFVDLYNKNSLDSKKDERLKNSGELIGFKFHKTSWGLNDFFYDWIYMNALLQKQNEANAKELIAYEAFTDIEFNPKKSYNCQAYSAALYKSALMRDYDLNLIKDPKKFKELFPREVFLYQQPKLFD